MYTNITSKLAGGLFLLLHFLSIIIIVCLYLCFYIICASVVAAYFHALLVKYCMCLCVVCMCIYGCGAACSVLLLVVSFSSSSEDEGLVQCYAIWIVE
jgi:hypothetical protein